MFIDDIILAGDGIAPAHSSHELLGQLKQETAENLQVSCNAVDEKIKSLFNDAIESGFSYCPTIQLGNPLMGKHDIVDFSVRPAFMGFKGYLGIALIHPQHTRYGEYISVSYSRRKKFKRVNARKAPRRILGISLGEKTVYDTVPDGVEISLFYRWGTGRDPDCLANGKGYSQDFFGKLIGWHDHSPQTTLMLLRGFHRAVDAVYQHYSELRDLSRQAKILSRPAQ